MNHQLMLSVLREVGLAVANKVYHSVTNQASEDLAGVVVEAEDDIIYQIDRDVEDIILPILSKYAVDLGGIALLAEGIGEDVYTPVVLPSSANPDTAAWRLIIDPIDGTRGIMYDKRSAFFLAGAAPNKGIGTKLSDIEVAFMAELPTSRAYLADHLWAIKGEGAHAETRNMLDGNIKPRAIVPSSATTVKGGFAQIARFFPPGRGLLATIEDELWATLMPEESNLKPLVFEDQYISTGGQVYQLLMGKDRFTADIRSHLFAHMAKTGNPPGHVCHPYDCAAFLIAQEAGLPITLPNGEPFDAPMALTAAVDWVGYANTTLKQQIEPILQQVMRKYQLM